MNVEIRCGFQVGRPLIRRPDGRVLVDVSFDGVLGTLWLLPCAAAHGCGSYHFGEFADQAQAESLFSDGVLRRLKELSMRDLNRAILAIEVATLKLGVTVVLTGVVVAN